MITHALRSPHRRRTPRDRRPPRSDAWHPQTWNPTALPSVAQIAQAIKRDWSQAQLEEYYREENLRKALY